MPAERIVHIRDYERRSRQPDAEPCRDPADADVIQFTPKRRVPIFGGREIEWINFHEIAQLPCDC